MASQYSQGMYNSVVLSSSYGPNEGGKDVATLQCQLIDRTDAAGVKTAIGGNAVVSVLMYVTPATIAAGIVQEQLAVIDPDDPLEVLRSNSIVGRSLTLYNQPKTAEQGKSAGKVFDNWSLATKGGARKPMVVSPASDEAIKKMNALLGFKGKPKVAALATVAADDF